MARELAEATLGMIGGQYLDITGADVDLGAAAPAQDRDGSSPPRSGSASALAEVREADQPPWRAFGEELGMLFQVVDDILDGDGYAERLGVEQAQDARGRSGDRAHAALAAIPADTSVLAEIVDSLAVRTA